MLSTGTNPTTPPFVALDPLKDPLKDPDDQLLCAPISKLPPKENPLLAKENPLLSNDNNPLVSPLKLKIPDVGPENDVQLPPEENERVDQLVKNAPDVLALPDQEISPLDPKDKPENESKLILPENDD